MGKELSELRWARVRSGMTLDELAQAAGISNSYLSLLERGHRRMSDQMERRLWDALGMTKPRVGRDRRLPGARGIPVRRSVTSRLREAYSSRPILDLAR